MGREAILDEEVMRILLWFMILTQILFAPGCKDDSGTEQNIRNDRAGNNYNDGLFVATRTEEGGTFTNEEIRISSIVWRFISHRKLQKGSWIGIAVSGTWKATWYNETERKLRVTPYLKFLDVNQLEVKNHMGSYFIILPGKERLISNQFEIYFDNLGGANLIESMEVRAKFEDEN